MCRLARLAFIVALVGAGAAVPPSVATAQDPTASGRPRIGLVLSGGAAKGLAHIGVLQALEAAGVPIDLVTGTSMGSLVGGLYAVGYTPAELAAIATTLDWDANFTDRPSRRFLTPAQRAQLDRTVLTLPIADGTLQLPAGVVRGREIYRLLSRLTWSAHDERDFATLPVPFRAVATDIVTGEAVVLRAGVLADAMRASLAIPGVFTPFARDGRLLVDGGVVRNLPASDARAMGAEFVICSDVSAPLSARADLRSLVDVLLQTVSFQMTSSTDAERTLCDVVITPEAGEGSLFSFADADGWIARGAEATRAALPGIPHRSAEVARDRAAGVPLLPAVVHVREVTVRGLDDPAALRTARRLLTPLTRGPVTAARVDTALRALDATGEFGQVTYRVQADRGDTTLVFDLSRELRSQFGIGIRYDDTYDAALLFSAAFAGWPDAGATTTAELRLGEQLQATLRRDSQHGPRSQLVSSVDATFLRIPIPLYQQGARVAEIRADAWRVAAFGGVATSHGVLAGVRFTGALDRADVSVAPRDSGEHRGHASVAALLWYDSFDRGAFPTGGMSLYAKTEWATNQLDGAFAFGHHVADARVARTLRPGLSVLGRATAGYAHGDRLPFAYQFRVGGAFPTSILLERHVPLAGFEPLELPGRAVQVAALGLRQRVADGVFLTGSLEAGGAFDAWRVDPDAFRVGGSVAIGAETLLGPVQAAVAARRAGGPYSLAISIGHGF